MRIGLSAAHSVCPGQVTGVSEGNLLYFLLAGAPMVLFPLRAQDQKENEKETQEHSGTFSPPWHPLGLLSTPYNPPNGAGPPSSHSHHRCRCLGSAGVGGVQSPPPRHKGIASAHRVNTGEEGRRAHAGTSALSALPESQQEG